MKGRSNCAKKNKQNNGKKLLKIKNYHKKKSFNLYRGGKQKPNVLLID